MINNKKLASIRWLLKSLLIVVFIISGYLILSTEKGLKSAILFGKEFLPGQLKIKIIHGRVLGPIQLKELYYQNNKINLYISETQFDWHWNDLLKGKLNLGPIFIDKLNLFVKQKINQKKLEPSRQKTYRLPQILKYLKLNSVDIHQINVQTDAISLLVQGSVHQQWNINWHINVKDLNKFIPESRGKIILRGRIKGTSLYPEIDIIAEKTNLLWYDWQFKQIQGAINIASKNKKWFFNLNTIQLNNKIFKFAPLQLKLSGSFSPFSLQGNLSKFKLEKFIQATQSTQLIVPNTKIDSHLSKHGLETSLQISSSSKNQLFAHLLLPNYQMHSFPTSKQTLYANIDLSLKDLNFLTQLITDLKNTKGICSAQIRIIGSFNKPLLNLNLNLQQASTEIPVLGLKLKNIKYQLHTDKNNLIGIGQIYSGNGFLEVYSTTDLLKQNLSTLIDLQGKDVTIIDNPEYQITATPKLKILANRQQIETSGIILFPKGSIKINPKNNNSITLSNDIVFVEDKKKPVNSSFKFKNDIKIEAGNDIQLQYQGLHTKLKGSLTIKQDFNHPVLASGQLKLFPGEYSYYGQSLKLKANSSLNFSNTPISDPTLNITASRNILILPVSTQNISVDAQSKLGSNNFIQSSIFSSQSIPISLETGIQVRGTLQDPHIILFANPSNIIKSQLDMLSYLITGHASNQLSAASTQLLLTAASNLGNEKSNIGQIISKVQQKMGLDQLTIGNKPIFNPTTNSLQQNTSLIVGKNISPKLNISYSLGLLDQISILNINYVLNKNFYLQTTSSNFANGLDLFYKLEKQ